MTPDEIKAKATALAEFYTAKAEGKTLQYNIPVLGWRNAGSTDGPDMQSDLSRWRIKPEPRRRWEIKNGGIKTDSETKAQEWRGLGFDVTEWVEVLP